LQFNNIKYKYIVRTAVSLVILVISTIQLRAQVFYSANGSYFKSKTEQNNLVSQYSFNYPDTSITELSQFAPRNFLGNTGLASPNYQLNYKSDDLGFKLFSPPNSHERFVEKQLTYYRTKGPYAELTGIAGDKKLQIFRMLFTHTYKDRLNVTLRFNRYTSQGFYIKQQTYTDNFYLNSNYSNKKNNWGYYFFILTNGNKNQENGGIKDGVLNDSTVSLNKELFKVKLDSSSRENRDLKVMVNPWLKLNRKQDSVSQLHHYVQLKSAFSSASFKYKSGDSYADKFYTHYYYTAINSQDSSHVRQFSNELNYTLKTKQEKLVFSLGYKHEINQVWQKKDSLIINQLIKADIRFSDVKRGVADTLNTKKIDNLLSFQYIMVGPNSGNYQVENKFAYTLNEKKKNELYFKFLAEKRSPDFIYTYWNSNHFKWFNNGYKAQEKIDVSTGVNFGKSLNVNLFYQNYFHFLYYDQYALPKQYAKTIENLGLSITLTKILFKHLGVSINHIYQQSSKPAYIRIPQNITTARLFYHGNLFKNNLQLQLGSQVQFYQSFKAYGYMPATQTFYLQDKATTAALPFLDIYLHARVKPVTIFIKLENALQGLVGNNYSFVPGYFQPDRALRFGITWVFFD
jgi:hypothetical protein